MKKPNIEKGRLVKLFLLIVIGGLLLIPTGLTFTAVVNQQQQTSYEMSDQTSMHFEIWDCVTRCSVWGAWSAWGLVAQTPIDGGFLCDYEQCRTRTRHCREICWLFGQQWSNEDWWETQEQCQEKQCYSIGAPCPATPTC